MRREDYARFAFAAAFGVWFIAAAGLLVTAVSQHVVLQVFIVAAGICVAYLYHKQGNRFGFEVRTENDENTLTGNSGQPRVAVSVGLSHPKSNSKASS